MIFCGVAMGDMSPLSANFGGLNRSESGRSGQGVKCGAPAARLSTERDRAAAG